MSFLFGSSDSDQSQQNSNMQNGMQNSNMQNGMQNNGMNGNMQNGNMQQQYNQQPKKSSWSLFGGKRHRRGKRGTRGKRGGAAMPSTSSNTGSSGSSGMMSSLMNKVSGNNSSATATKPQKGGFKPYTSSGGVAKYATSVGQSGGRRKSRRPRSVRRHGTRKHRRH